MFIFFYDVIFYYILIIDFIKFYLEKKLLYFSGTVYIQPWGPVSTTETRLVGSNIDKYDFYNCFDAEEKFFYYNTIDRTFVRHSNPFADRSFGFDLCNDCSLEGKIWDDYLSKFNISQNVLFHVRNISVVLGKILKRDGHGELFQGYDENWYKNIYNKYCYISH